jgi:protein-S-isoprenylcysteine O-methyltransferase Ste14
MATLWSRQLRFPSVAIALYGISAALFWWAVGVTRGKLAACGQKCVSPVVLEKGPYRVLRHPFYTAYNLTWLAGFAATGWWPIAITAFVMAVLYERSAREEERGFLNSALAAEYRKYRLRAGKYLPRIVSGPRLSLHQ